MYNLKFVNFNKKDTNYNNIGDLYCSPSLYFKFKNYTLVDYNDYSPSKTDVCILGGGGIFTQWHYQSLNKYLQCHKKIIWSAGINNHERNDYYLERGIHEFDLVGLRDDNRYHQFDFVPCVSCMHDGFSKQYQIQHDIVVYEHYDVPIDINLPKENNRGDDIEEKIYFLGTANKIVTNTYHGMYWGLMLKKTVVLYKPFSSRFLYFPVNILHCDSSNYIYQLNKSLPFLDLLDKYREINKNYYKKVYDLLNSVGLY